MRGVDHAVGGEGFPFEPLFVRGKKNETNREETLKGGD